MPDEIKAPYYSYEDLRREADKFLGEYHPAGTIPVPIEQIVEFQFRVDIVPTHDSTRTNFASPSNDVSDVSTVAMKLTLTEAIAKFRKPTFGFVAHRLLGIQREPR